MRNIQILVRDYIKEQGHTVKSFAAEHNIYYTGLTRFLTGNRSIRTDCLIDILLACDLLPERKQLPRSVLSMDAATFISVMESQSARRLYGDLSKLSAFQKVVS